MTDPHVDAALERALSSLRAAAPPRLYEAVSYAVFPGGARVRPRLCVEVARACLGPGGGEVPELTYAAGAAVELLHCASLAHDDLPCFDDADTRRGRPSLHKQFDEATAVLVGDGLIVHAFETLARALTEASPASAAAGACAAPMLALLASAGARHGLVAGQAWELEPSVDLAAYHRAKTGSLFEAAASLGAYSVGANASAFAAMGRAFGAAYQIADDLADRLGDEEMLGKPTGKDRLLGRPTAATGSEDDAFERYERAVALTLDAVPSCPGEGELRRFLEGGFAALAARVRRSRPERPSKKPAKTRACA